MPIYEYVCPSCGRKSSFLVRNIAAHRTPRCPRCGAEGMKRAISRFSALGRRRGNGSAGEPAAAGGEDFSGSSFAETGPGDESGRPEPDLGELESVLRAVDEEDPRSIGRAMRKLAEQSGEPLDEEMEEVVRRLEAGEDPDKIDEDFGGEMGGGEEDELFEG